ncbi:tRNA pseudouridine(55) synthase TruB [Gammaproteobacteria bacterium]|nr:tRNA pseudouridine(55) synthase TruB [Gammaproteobacteria bacterium]
MARRKNKGRSVHGIVVLDKALGGSSNHALQQVKRLFDANKAGHTGALDPLATGVLPLCLGEATKVSQFLLDSDKAYRARIKLGVRTDTADSEGEVIATADAGTVTEAQIKSALTQFEGDIEQVPPMYSALKRDGQPLYKLAREGKTVEREPRAITVYSIELTDFDPQSQELEIEVDCSKGTYIRTIADDLGQIIGCGAHIIALRRLKAGAFTLADSQSLEELEAAKQADGFTAIDAMLMPMDKAIDTLPAVHLPAYTAQFLKQGQAVQVNKPPADGLLRLYEDEEFIGIGIIDDDGKVAPKRLIVKD